MTGQVITVIAGNTNCRLVLFVDGIANTIRTRPLAGVLASPGSFLSGIVADDAALASVVPSVTRPLSKVLSTFTGRPVFLLTTRAKTGLDIRYDRHQLGADRLCVAEGARARWKDDIAVLDFGTAVTVNFISRKGVFEGGPIMPGPGLMLSALSRGTARLAGSGSISIRSNDIDTLPRRTRTAIATGVLTAVAGGVEHTLNRVQHQTGRKWRLVGTGGNAQLIAPMLSRQFIFDPLLGCRGLYELYLRNRVGHD